MLQSLNWEMQRDLLLQLKRLQALRKNIPEKLGYLQKLHLSRKNITRYQQIKRKMCTKQLKSGKYVEKKLYEIS